ncbi:GT4 family glycosyltransferase PelF [Cytobacillus sp. IB215665]|uniref:GT4 family glycosyltransferase PelF n=1 Tax=Cytobacillus sp. IB215665 TaxID=3097357 RepID=UPI002A0B3208|nr:GT4 family glycosyltransferase PelF [Cytobacillus sp. IB215665]MDX8366090.1 GT4 family glycosyltransferase PelF [Cytobacillus sp. IB215665]
MKICLVAEGSYPYITGGVSSWIQSLISNISEHEFIVYTIGAEKKLKGKFKYSLPNNVSHVVETFLDEFDENGDQWGGRYNLSLEEKAAIRSLLDSRTTKWDVLFSLFSSHRIKSVTSFLKSRDFFEIVQEICLEKYSEIPFTEMFWTLRSMVLPLFLAIKNSLPEADIYHSVSTGYAGVIGSLGSFLYDKPLVLTEHGIYTREREEEIIKAKWVKGYFKDLWIQYFYNMSNCTYSYANNIVTLFNKNKEIQIELGCAENKISIIPNGIDIKNFEALSLKQEKSKDDIFIGAIVRVVPIKDIKTMLQSFSIVKASVPNAKFYILGPLDEDKEYYEECVQLVNSLHLKDVIFTGEVNIKDYIMQLDILVLSSISEGQPLAILEGMACGKPFVATDVGNCKGLLMGEADDLGAAGIIVPMMQYVMMGQAIIKLCENAKLRKSYGENGKKRVRTFYQKETFIDNYKQLYNKTVIN